MDNVEAEVDIEFDNNSTTTGETIPSADAVATTLQEEVSNPNSTFNLTIDKDSIEANEKNTTTVTPMTSTATAEALTTITLEATTTKGATTAGSNTTGGSTTDVVATTSKGPTPTAGSNATGGVTTTTTKGAATTTGETVVNVTTLSTTSTTTATTTTTTFAPPPVVVVVVVAVLLEPYEPELANPSSPQFIVLAERIFVVYDAIYRRRYRTYSRCIVRSFRPAAVQTRMDNVEAEVDIEFDNNSTTTGETIPSADAVATTLQEEVSNPNSTFNLTIDKDSIEANEKNTTTVTPMTSTATAEALTTITLEATTTGETVVNVTTLSTTSTTTATTTTTTFAPPLVVVVLVAVVLEPYVQELANPSSPQFIVLADRIFVVYDAIYRRRYRAYSRCIPRGFRPAADPTRMENIEAEVDIEFDNTTTPGETIPSAEAVATTLQEEVSNPNNAFNLPIDPQSITAFVKNTTTVAPTTAEALTTRRVTFRSAGEEFTTDLLNSFSAAFINRASTIKTTLEPFYQITFTSFRTLTVVSFSNGSILNNMDLTFVSSTVPNNRAIASVLVNVAPNITAFNVDISFIFVDGAQVSSGASHKTKLISASCLVLLSWLLANQQ